MENNDLWYEMLTTYCYEMHYEGLTLPNMIGAYYCFDNTIDLSSSKCAAQLLEDITRSQKGIEVLIQKCGNIRHYVLKPFKGKHPQQNKLNDKILLNIYDSDLKQHSSNVDDLAEYLYSLHREEISTKNFSFTNDAWHPLSNVELGHINNIIHSL